MADYAFYWPQYLNESGEDGNPVTSWLTSRGWLVNRLQHNDRIWLFIAGDACDDEEGRHRAYVAQLLVVDKWGYFAEFEPGVLGSPQFHIHGIENRCILVKPPALVDEIFRNPGADSEQHIGIAKQVPFELEGGQVAELLTLLKQRYSEVHAVATQL